MTDQAIKQLIQSEIYKARQTGAFNLQTINRHEHNNVSSNPINQGDTTPGFKAEGRISFDQTTTYKIGLTFNPHSIAIQGNVTGASGEKFIVVSNAQFGPSFYMQPQSTTSVVIGGPQQTILQSTTYFGSDGSNFHTVADEGHIVDVEYPLNTIHARATITKYDNTGFYVTVDDLDANWEITLSFTVT